MYPSVLAFKSEGFAGAPEGFFCNLVSSVVAILGGFYPELAKAQDTVPAISSSSHIPCMHVQPPSTFHAFSSDAVMQRRHWLTYGGKGIERE